MILPAHFSSPFTRCRTQKNPYPQGGGVGRGGEKTLVRNELGGEQVDLLLDSVTLHL